MQWFSSLFRKETTQYPEFWNSYASLFNNNDIKTVEKTQFVVFDTETTGFNFLKDRILSIGAIKIKQNEIIINSALELFIIQKKFSKETVKIHGILRFDSRAELTEIEALQAFLNYIGNAVLVAHHAAYDVGMINAALERHGLPQLKNKVLDTYKLYKATRIRTHLIDESNFSLDKIAENYQLDVSDRHTAAGDALLTAMVFLKTVSILQTDKKYSLAQLIKKFK